MRQKETSFLQAAQLSPYIGVLTKAINGEELHASRGLLCA
jgi:hypothetical protein